jgi:hypothetical protein
VPVIPDEPLLVPFEPPICPEPLLVPALDLVPEPAAELAPPAPPPAPPPPAVSIGVIWFELGLLLESVSPVRSYGKPPSRVYAGPIPAPNTAMVERTSAICRALDWIMGNSFANV